MTSETNKSIRQFTWKVRNVHAATAPRAPPRAGPRHPVQPGPSSSRGWTCPSFPTGTRQATRRARHSYELFIDSKSQEPGPAQTILQVLEIRPATRKQTRRTGQSNSQKVIRHRHPALWPKPQIPPSCVFQDPSDASKAPAPPWRCTRRSSRCGGWRQGSKSTPKRPDLEKQSGIQNKRNAAGCAHAPQARGFNWIRQM